MSPDFASIAFVDLAGFSAIADVYGDASAIAVLEVFEGLGGAKLKLSRKRIRFDFYDFDSFGH